MGHRLHRPREGYISACCQTVRGVPHLVHTLCRADVQWGTVRNVVESMQALLAGAKRFNFKLNTTAAEEAAVAILSLDPLSADFWVCAPVRVIVY